jgi:large subunit ribosomal protein L22
MRALLRNARIAPKKASIVAKMVRGIPAGEAVTLLQRTHKKAARLLEDLLLSALANARHNDRQPVDELVVSSVVVNQGAPLRRGVPMARGRMRPMTKFLSHISLTLGYPKDGPSIPTAPAKTEAKKTAAKAKPVKPVKTPRTKSSSSPK